MSSKASTPCSECRGRGWLDIACARPEEARICSLCNGTGVTPTEKECTGCRGTGRLEIRVMEQKKCWRCSGTGIYPPPEEM